MTVEELIIYGKKFLHTTNTKMLLANILGYDYLELLNHLNETVDEENIQRFKEYIDTIKNNKPIQYLIGSVNFYGYEFIVNEKVLIPRFETEELVEKTIEFILSKFQNKNLKVIDLGTGSGIIGITLKKKIPELDITCLDISKEALNVTRGNAERLGVEINTIEGDMLENITDKFDVIISNPPYIRNDEEIEKVVKDNEPSVALYGGPEGLDYYRKILKQAKNNLNEKYLIAFEIGKDQKEAIINLAKGHFSDAIIECRNDLQENERMIFIYKI